MKLPGIDYNNSVESLGREDPYAPIRAASAQAQAAAGAGIGFRSLGAMAIKLGGFLKDQENRYAEHEASMAAVNAAREMQDTTFRRKEQGEIPAEEIPESIKNSVDGRFERLDDGSVEYAEPVSARYHEFALEFYDADAASIGEKYLNNLKTDAAKKAFGLMWAKASVRGRGPIINEAIELSKEVVKAETIGMVDSLVKEGETDAAVVTIRRHVPDIFSPLEAQKLINEARYKGAMVGPNMAIMNKDVEAMTAYMEAANSEDYNGPLSLENRLALSRTLEARIDEVQAEDRAEVLKNSAQEAAKLKIGVDNATVSHSMLLEAHDKGVISRETYISWSSQLAKNHKKKVGTVKVYAGFAEAIQNNQPIDDSDKKTKKALNGFWKDQMGGTYDSAKILAVHSNVMPSDATNKMLMDSNSGDPDKILEAAQFYLDITQIGNGGKAFLFKDISGDKSQMLRLVAQNLSTGVEDPVGRAAAAANITPQERDALNTTYPKLKAKNAEWLTDAAASDDHTDVPWTFGAPTPTAQMQGEFNNLVYQNYIANNGDIENARQSAFRELTSRWRATAVSPNGEQIITKFPPEQVLGLPATVISEDIADYVKPLAALDENVRPDEVFIVSDEKTEGDPLRNGWSLMYLDEFGGIRPLRNADGAPVRYNPTRAEVTERRTGKAVKTLDARRKARSPAKGGDPFEMIREQHKKLLKSTEDARNKVSDFHTPFFVTDD